MEKSVVNKKIIIKGIGGFYYVKTADAIFETKPKGIFRNINVKPLAGDFVEIEEVNGDYVITEIHERKNSFLRPPIANVDKVFIVVSTVEPLPNYTVIDKMTAICIKKGIVPDIIITKTDLLKDNELFGIYEKSGFSVTDINGENAYKEIIAMMKGGLSVFAGNTGVGKSTVLNRLFSHLNLETAKISRKLGRGRHTTRAVEIYDFEGGSVADTPGFSYIDTEREQPLYADEIEHLFPEISPHIGKCRFNDCSHTSEIGCAVIEKVKSKEISESRYKSYCDIRKEAEGISRWEQND
jgi:ribosome biogenesis GTPase